VISLSSLASYHLSRLLSRGSILLVIGLTNIACSGAPQLTSTGERDPSFSDTRGHDSTPTAIKPTSQQSSREVALIFNQHSIPDDNGTTSDYRLAPMDVVDVSVFEAPNLSRTAQISSTGYVTLPLIRDVKASGRTTDQLQQGIQQPACYRRWGREESRGHPAEGRHNSRAGDRIGWWPK
jgi:hypothetical protein